MYKCAVTGVISKPGEPLYKVTVETREVTYELPPKRSKGRNYSTEPRVVEGSEIVKEVGMCYEAKRLWEDGKINYFNGKFFKVT